MNMNAFDQDEQAAAAESYVDALREEMGTSTPPPAAEPSSLDGILDGDDFTY